MKIAVEPKLEALRESVTAQALRTVRPLADRVDRNRRTAR